MLPIKKKGLQERAGEFMRAIMPSFDELKDKMKKDGKDHVMEPLQAYKAMFVAEKQYIDRNIAALSTQIRHGDDAIEADMARITELFKKLYVDVVQTGLLREVMKVAQKYQDADAIRKDTYKKVQQDDYKETQERIKASRSKKQQAKNRDLDEFLNL